MKSNLNLINFKINFMNFILCLLYSLNGCSHSIYHFNEPRKTKIIKMKNNKINLKLEFFITILYFVIKE